MAYWEGEINQKVVCGGGTLSVMKPNEAFGPTLKTNEMEERGGSAGELQKLTCELLPCDPCDLLSIDFYCYAAMQLGVWLLF